MIFWFRLEDNRGYSLILVLYFAWICRHCLLTKHNYFGMTSKVIICLTWFRLHLIPCFCFVGMFVIPVEKRFSLFFFLLCLASPLICVTYKCLGVAILRGAGCGLLAIFYFLYLVLILAFLNMFIYSSNKELNSCTDAHSICNTCTLFPVPVNCSCSSNDNTD